MSEKKEENQEEPKEDVITHIPLPRVVAVPLEVVGNVTSTPTGAWMLLFLYIFITPFLAWLFDWSWWPGFGIYIILVVIFGVILAYWGHLRRGQASVKTKKAKPETKN